MTVMDSFVDDDPGYLDWLTRHPDSFVINTGRRPSAAYLMLHRASCGTISETPARGKTFTGDYAKVCGGQDERKIWRASPASWGARRSLAVCASARLPSHCHGHRTAENTAPCVITSRAVPATGPG